MIDNKIRSIEFMFLFIFFSIMLYCNIFLFDYFVFVMNYFSLNNKYSYNVWQTNLKQSYFMNIYSFIFFRFSKVSFCSCSRFILGRWSTKNLQLLDKILFYHEITKIIGCYKDTLSQHHIIFLYYIIRTSEFALSKKSIDI